MIRFCSSWGALFLFGTALSSTWGQEIRFSDRTRAAGLLEPLAGIMGHGGAFGDFDGDGLLDIYVGGFCDRPDSEYHPAAGPVPNRLFRNLGNGKFEMVQQPAVAFYGRTSGAVFADLNNNGMLDLYVANNAKPDSKGKVPELQIAAKQILSKLFRNDQGTFVDISEASGACPPQLHTARNIGVFDYDQDGLLDLLIIEDRFRKGPRCVLLRNLGHMKFQDVTKEVGLPDDLYGLGLAVADVNEDGRPDFFVPHSNRFFLSRPDGTYYEPEELKRVFAWQPLNGEDWPCGAAFGDLNRNGRLDLVLGIHHVKARNKVFINEGLKNGVPQFRDVTAEVGFPEALPNKSPHVEIQDFNNDGWPDIYFSTAWLDDDGTATPIIFRNTGVNDKGLPQFVPNRPLQGEMVYYPAGPSGDYDNDGRIDLFLINWFQGNHSRLLRNESPPWHWLNVRVTGKTFNRMGIGSQVRVYRAGQLGKADALLGFQEVTIGYGYASGQPAVCHFGLGDETKVDLRVKLPNGKIVDKQGIAADQRLVIEEP
ncbi:MAG: CRTAC1 family protein [Gemmataceae bacterium]